VRGSFLSIKKEFYASDVVGVCAVGVWVGSGGNMSLLWNNSPEDMVFERSIAQFSVVLLPRQPVVGSVMSVMISFVGTIIFGIKPKKKTPKKTKKTPKENNKKKKREKEKKRKLWYFDQLWSKTVGGYGDLGRIR